MDSVGRHGRFHQGQIGFLETFANLAALAIENANLYQKLRDENSRLRQEVHRVHGFKGNNWQKQTNGPIV